ncbi:hypothetical protein HJC23_003456 [Cyclotella cryptica]|uniref:Mitochondrial glycoprotein n=1 Tax=Cyclotella cryptica TaxID=29204 RepID=A0ABD3QUD0_9STRA|eukprot:CCRYP_002598-RA/>CCRYP_002598-RA protein AED:0.04 eAED:0.04 QI:160/1/1/1/1/1/2/528/285
MLRSTVLVRRLAASSLTTRAAVVACSTTEPISSRSISRHTSNHMAAWTPPLNSRTLSSSSSRKLGSILQREITEETDAGSGASTLPEELQTLYDDISKDWTIVQGITGIGSDETGSGATVRMFKKENGSNGAKIGVVFHCQDTEEDHPFNEDELYEDQRADEEEEQEEPATAVRFAVTVSKGGHTVVIQCRSVEGELSVESVAVRDGDAEGALLALAGGEGLHSSLYQGPEFDELAPDLQEAFHNYVQKECGVDEDLTAFITMYADYREQEEYVSWMKTAVNVLA